MVSFCDTKEANMAERVKSKDGVSETERFIDRCRPARSAGALAGQPRAQGRHPRRAEAGRTRRRRDPRPQVGRGGRGQSRRPPRHRRRRLTMTQLKQGTWVVVADGEKALILENITDGAGPAISRSSARKRRRTRRPASRGRTSPDAATTRPAAALGLRRDRLSRAAKGAVRRRPGGYPLPLRASRPVRSPGPRGRTAGAGPASGPHCTRRSAIG